MSMMAQLRVWSEQRVPALVGELARDADVLEVVFGIGPGGSRLVDCGVATRGSWEAGRRLAVLSHAGMLKATLGVREVAGLVLPELVCDAWRPAVSTYGLQVSFALTEVDPAIRVSGPIRAAVDGLDLGRRSASRRSVRDAAAAWGVAIVESEELPDANVVSAIARRAGLRARDLTLFVVPNRSLAGVAQIAGRLNECVLFTLGQSLRLDPACVVSILGSTLLAPTGEGAFVTQDDLIHYAGRVTMVVDAPETWNLDDVAHRLTFRSSAAYGQLFADLLAAAGGVFEAIPGVADLNKVAEITIVDRVTGVAATAGAIDEAILTAAWRRGGA